MSARHNHVTREIRPKGSGCPACDEYHDSQADKERIAIIGASGPLRPGIDIDGAAEFDCVECGNPVVIAPSGQEIIRTEGAEPLCPACGLGAAQTSGGVEQLRPEQLDEIMGPSFGSRDPFA